MDSLPSKPSDMWQDRQVVVAAAEKRCAASSGSCCATSDANSKDLTRQGELRWPAFGLETPPAKDREADMMPFDRSCNCESVRHARSGSFIFASASSDIRSMTCSMS